MTDTSSGSSSGDLAAVPERTAEAAAALASLKGPADAAASAIDQAFVRAGESLAKTLSKAAADGKLSLSDLAKSVIEAVDATAHGGAGGAGPLGAALTGVLTSVFGGARADGGAVTAGGTYLVGERGPELFRPAGSGEIAPSGGGGGVTVNLNLPAGTDAPALVRSQAQVAQALSRAVALARR